MAHKNTYIDYTGIKFNKLTVLGLAERSPTRPHKRRWIVKCDCGNTSNIETSSITGKKKIESCGKCIKYNWSGKDLGWIKVISYAYLDKKRRSHKWNCVCKCGYTRIVDTSILTTKRYKNCKNCKPKYYAIGNKYALKHGLTKHKASSHPLYRMRNGMMTRCYNAKKSDYPYYQGKGIEVYKEWVNSPLAFYNWAINNGWQEGLTIDRIDPECDYEPDNCRFITMVENIKNACRYKHNKITK